MFSYRVSAFCLAAAISQLFPTQSSLAAPIEYQLVNVSGSLGALDPAFDITGSFIFDSSTNAVSSPNINISPEFEDAIGGEINNFDDGGGHNSYTLTLYFDNVDDYLYPYLVETTYLFLDLSLPLRISSDPISSIGITEVSGGLQIPLNVSIATGSIQPESVPVPEPSSLLIFAAAATIFAAARRRSRGTSLPRLPCWRAR
jgi:hypothetical protein